MSAVSGSVASIAASLSFIESLPFSVHSSGTLAFAAIASQDHFEGAILRDAEDGEAAYFQVTNNDENDENDAQQRLQEVASKNGLIAGSIDPAAHNHLRRSILGRSIAANDRNQRWNIVKKAGPARVAAPPMPTPLRRRPRDVNNAARHTAGDVEDPEPYLIAANKMLQMYPMQQASEHVQLLYSQYEGLMESIADLEEALQEPLPKRSAPSAASPPPQMPSVNELEQLEADIRREELEILALKEMKAERDKQSRDLDTQLRSKRNPPAAVQSRMPTNPSNTASFPKPAVPKLPPTMATAATATKSMFDRNSEARQAAKRLPSVVAKKLASENAEAAIASPPRSPANRQTAASSPRSASSKAPAAGSPIRARQATNASQASSADLDATPKKAPRQREPVPKAEQSKSAVPEEQLKHALAKIAICRLQSTQRTESSAEAVLTKLQSLSLPTVAPGSPESTVSSLATGANATEPAIKLEYHILHLYLDLLLGHPSSSLELIFRESAIAGPCGPQDAMLSMNAIKTVLGDFAKANGWEGDLGTKAIYGLVAKRVLKIDRRGREALVCFTI